MNESGDIMAMLPWQIEALRFSFLNISSDVDEANFSWSTLTASEPETVTEKRGAAVITEEGPWRNGTLSVVKQPGRIDVTYSYSQQQEGPLPDAGLLLETLDVLRSWYVKFSKINANRFGLNGVVLLPVDSAEEGYERLKSFLPFVKFEPDMSSFYLQVNRKKTTPDNLKINELSKWSSIEIKTLRWADEGVPEGLSIIHAVRLEFDVNTAEHLHEAPQLNVVDVLGELERRVVALTRNGAL